MSTCGGLRGELRLPPGASRSLPGTEGARGARRGREAPGGGGRGAAGAREGRGGRGRAAGGALREIGRAHV